MPGYLAYNHEELQIRLHSLTWIPKSVHGTATMTTMFMSTHLSTLKAHPATSLYIDRLRAI